MTPSSRSEPILDIEAATEEKRHLEGAGRLHWFHWLVISGSLLLTLSAWYITKVQSDEKVRSRFDRESEQVVALITERMRKYEDALWAGAATIRAAGGNIPHSHWARYANSLSLEQKYPGINGIGVIHHVPPDQLETYLATQRIERPDYQLHPSHERPVFLPISYIEPAHPNRKAVGLDMAHEDNRYTAALKARDTGLAQITAPITLVQDAAKTPGFLFFAPYYAEPQPQAAEQRRQQFSGIVYAPFIARKLMEGTLAKANRQVGIRIQDGDAVLFNEHQPSEDDFDPTPLFTRHFDFEMYGRPWSFDVWSARSFRASASNSQPTVILVGGLAVDAMLLALFVLLSRSNQRAVRLAEHMSSGYRHQALQLDKSVVALQQRNQELEQFARVASHDLQEPLRTLASYSDLLKIRLAGTLNPDDREALTFIEASARRMKEMVQGLYDYCHLGADSPLQSINCDTLLDEVCSDLSTALTEIGAELEIQALPMVMGHPNELRRLFQNLIANAVKFHKKDAPPHITIHCERLESDWLFCVADDGIGIESDHLEQIFLIFKRLHTSEEYPGSGIGLAHCQKIVMVHGGRIWATSTPEHGSTFYFTLPASIPT